MNKYLLIIIVFFNVMCDAMTGNRLIINNNTDVPLTVTNFINIANMNKVPTTQIIPGQTQGIIYSEDYNSMWTSSARNGAMAFAFKYLSPSNAILGEALLVFVWDKEESPNFPYYWNIDSVIIPFYIIGHPLPPVEGKHCALGCLTYISPGFGYGISPADDISIDFINNANEADTGQYGTSEEIINVSLNSEGK